MGSEKSLGKRRKKKPTLSAYLHIGDYWSHKSRLTLFRENVSSKKKRVWQTYS